MSGKRRAAGPAVKKTPGKAPRRTRKQKTLRVLKWVGDHRPGDGADRHRWLRLPLPVDRHPGREQGLRDPDHARLLRGRQGRDRQLRGAEPRGHRHRRDARGPAERRRRGGEPVVLDRQGPRPQGHAARVPQQLDQRHDAGRVDDHPAVREDPLPEPGALLRAQGEGSGAVAEDPALDDARPRSSRTTSTPSTSAAAPTASRPPPRRTSPRTPRTSRCASPPSWRASSTTRRTSTRPTARTPSRPSRPATPTCSTAWPRPTTSPPTRPRRRRASCRRCPSPRRRAGTAARRATCSRWSARSCSGSASRTTEIDGGGLRVTTTFTEKAMDGRRAGRRRGSARGARGQGAPRRRRQRRARHRRGARHLRRPGLPRLPDQLGGRGRPGRLDPQAVRTGRRDP